MQKRFFDTIDFQRYTRIMVLRGEERRIAMKRIMLISFVLCLVMLFDVAHAKPVLVAVELDGREQIQFWLSQNYPTYEYIEKTAIVEIDDSQLPGLREQGFSAVVIDELAWSEQYFMSSMPAELRKDIPGKIIWQKGEKFLVKVPVDNVVALYTIKAHFQPFERTILPVRFWEQIMTKHVPLRAVDWDPFIQSIVDQVDTDSITAYIQRLQDFKTRLIFTDSSYAASEWLRQKFSGWGYATEFDSFWVSTSWPGSGYERNVIATVSGTMNPSKIFIICGHFDAIVWHDTAVAQYNAPGADDNASGTVAAMEAARIFRNYSWEPTMQFIGWAAEELGLLGSRHYARWADSIDLDIGGVVNLDMIGYMDDANLDCIIQRRDSPPLWLSDLFYHVGETYVPSLTVYPVTSGGGSDWYPFAQRGYASVGGAEAALTHFNPYYHDTTDLLSTLSPELYTRITKVSIATMAILGTYPSMVEDVVAYDVGDGSSLEVNWSANPETDIVGYKIYWGLTSEVYTDTHYVSGITTTKDTLTGLMTDSTYYIVVRAIDGDDRESYVATEVTGIPRELPFAPANVNATPIISGIRIDWAPSTELDLAGYRVYRRINENPDYDSLNTLLLTDTTFTNAPLSGADKYYYAIRAFDNSGNPSPMSDEVYGRPITLDQGILVVDETRNWTSGNYPHDTTQDNFYQYIMDGYYYSEYEYGSASDKPVLSDFVPYSTIIWFADDYIELMASENTSDFQNYLEIGGRLWFAGWKPTANLRNQQVYPADFSPGSFIHDYLKISQVNLSASTDSFQAAVGLLGYPALDVDPDKVPLPSWGGTMRYIEALTTVAPGEDIYTIDMANNSSPFEGDVCGVRYLGADYKTVFFGFPFYFMEQDQARAVAQKVMSDFGEVSVAERPKETVSVSHVQLQQSRPNPFTRQTLIYYQTPHAGIVQLKVYNIAGQLVKILVNERHDTGVYGVTWNGTDNKGKRVSSGVYFYELQVGDTSVMKKMTLLR